MNTNRNITLMALVAVALIASIIYMARTASKTEMIDDEASATTTAIAPAELPAIACTMDARMCPDGSYVGRTGPNCQFVCPKATTGAPAGTQYPADTFK